jgi:hypothetical protein
MNVMKDDLKRIANARQCLARVHANLLCPTPASLDRSAGDLQVAIRCLQKIETRLGSAEGSQPAANPALHKQILELRSELVQVNALLQGAGKFYEGWARLLASSTDHSVANYDNAGKSGSVALTGAESLVFHG